MTIEQNSLKQEREQNLEKVRREFAEKNEYLENGERYGVPLSQIKDIADFFGMIFERKSLSGVMIDPFEEKGSKEYRDWLRQKMAKVEKIDYSGYACWRYNPIIFYREKKNGVVKNRHRVVLRDDWDTMSWIENRDFAIMSPVTYVGGSPTAINARYLYAFAIDLDGVDLGHLKELFAQMTHEFKTNVEYGLPLVSIPLPNIIVNSGHGLHLYFILKEPIAMYDENVAILNKFKMNLTNIVWNWKTSSLEDTQYQGVFQGFRLPGTKTKFGEIITAWAVDDLPLYTLEELARWFGSDGRIITKEELQTVYGSRVYNPTGVTREEAARRWPEWYARRIVEKKKITTRWHIKRDLYDWWSWRMYSGRDRIKEHHRYWCILTLVVYGVKCDIPREEVLRDAMGLVERFNNIDADPDNPFTEEDVKDAMRAYDESYCNWPKHVIRRTTQLEIPDNRRNGRKQDLHLMLARNTRDFVAKLNGKKWDENNGRKIATLESSPHAKIIREWRNQHPDSHNKSECARDTGLSRPTVTRWWK